MNDDADDEGGEDVELQLNMGDEVLDHEISSGESDDGVAAARNMKQYLWTDARLVTEMLVL